MRPCSNEGVPIERRGRVVGTGREFFGERVRTDHGESGAVTEEGHAWRSIANHRDPALRPASRRTWLTESK
jgi:hypothetical protein